MRENVAVRYAQDHRRAGDTLTDAHNCDYERLVNQYDHRLTEPGTHGDTGSWERFVIARCPVCNDWWGIRFQHDAGTGMDDRYHRYGPDEPKRRVVAR